MKQDLASSKARFAGFEVDLRTGDLHKDGHRVRVQAQPLKALRVLLENSGELVTREELRKQVWPEETFVDFDHGLNKSIAKLREVLDERDHDSSLIETIPRQGYRFLAPVEWTTTQHVPQDSRGELPPSPRTSREPSRPLGRWILALAAAIGLVALSSYLYVRRASKLQPSPTITAIAVLPLENLSGDKNQDYFADGMTDELITMLAQNSSLRVISRTSVMQYKGVHRQVSEIARTLGVDAIVEGTVARDGDNVRVTTQLIYAPTDTHLWAESYVRNVKDVFALQQEVAETVAARVNAQPSSSPSPRHTAAIKPEAYDAYLRGRYYWFADRQLEKTREYFTQAVTLQPDYAAAWSGLADVTMVKAIYGDAEPSTVRAESERLTRKALQLDDSLAEAHNSMAAIHLFFDWDFNAADQETQRAIALNPNFAEAHHLRSYALQAMNRFDESIDEAKKAIALDPGARPWGLAYAYILTHRYDDSLKEARVRLEAHPDNAALHFLLSNIYHFKGMNEESVAELKEGLRLQHDTAKLELVKKLYASGGMRAIFKNDLIETEDAAKKGYVSPHTIARRYATLGNKEKTMKYLEDAFAVRTPRLIRVHIDPEFEFLHSDPRFIELAHKVGLTVPK